MCTHAHIHVYSRGSEGTHVCACVCETSLRREMHDNGTSFTCNECGTVLIRVIRNTHRVHANTRRRSINSRHVKPLLHKPPRRIVSTGLLPAAHESVELDDRVELCVEHTAPDASAVCLVDHKRVTDVVAVLVPEHSEGWWLWVFAVVVVGGGMWYAVVVVGGCCSWWWRWWC